MHPGRFEVTRGESIPRNLRALLRPEIASDLPVEFQNLLGLALYRARILGADMDWSAKILLTRAWNDLQWKQCMVYRLPPVFLSLVAVRFLPAS